MLARRLLRASWSFGEPRFGNRFRKRRKGDNKSGSNNSSFDSRASAECRDLNIDPLYRALTAPGIFTEEHPRLCFYLEHQYPMNGMKERADSVTRKLKGHDALLYHALIRTGVRVTFHHVLFPTDPENWKIKHKYEDSFDPHLHAILPRWVASIDAPKEVEGGTNEIINFLGGGTPRVLGIIEVTKNPDKFVKIDYIAYGNEPWEDTDYGTICMVATMHGFDVDEPWNAIQRDS
ncbi:uncharacterized protein EI90DRAFT_3127143 [Cantharellus anzutake]|uniref:uncharacterized protein n=1 Tax=Cantharellus anzutake TaxID=1750568 RepID=UPI001908F2F9|nr:uncharacterized protein EI90DRAFT_3127143 [Cantharellus anzutake]KAF8327457.1 hypothetical protein EI90DRAFT_3127143 [Cantharellus anzutake]